MDKKHFDELLTDLKVGLSSIYGERLKGLVDRSGHSIYLETTEAHRCNKRPADPCQLLQSINQAQGKIQRKNHQGPNT